MGLNPISKAIGSDMRMFKVKLIGIDCEYLMTVPATTMENVYEYLLWNKDNSNANWYIQSVSEVRA